ncbi:MAG: CpsD/CapB family tyrosine-protein kinase [Chloroflexi bacterium]|nr:CpsD/CapB family tyrosine-protein kinase [Chloroflexota bacterium]
MTEHRNVLVTINQARSLAAEAYRTLRTNIQFASLDHPLRTLVVTSPGPEDGKTTTLANLAVSFAQAGVRALVVDCDLRRPSLHRLFALPNEQGLTSYLLDDSAGAPPIQQTEVENLAMLSTGPLPHNPSELLGSRRMERAIESLAEHAELILFDTPPVAAVSDAVVLGRKVDGVLLVIGAGRTRRDHATQARRALERASVNVIGAVLNNARLDASLYRHYG